jgi:hypothetical protein
MPSNSTHADIFKSRATAVNCAGTVKLRSSRAFKRAKGPMCAEGRPSWDSPGWIRRDHRLSVTAPRLAHDADYFTSNQGKLAELKAMFLDEAKKK